MIHNGSTCRPRFLGAQLALPWPGSDHLTIVEEPKLILKAPREPRQVMGLASPWKQRANMTRPARLRIVIEAPSIGRVALGEPTAASMWTQRLVAFKLSTGRLFQANPTGAPPFRLLAPAH